MRVRIIGALVVVALVGACSLGEARSYDSLADLRAAVEGIGLACADVEPAGGAELVEAAATCSETDLGLYTFRDREDLERWTSVASRLGTVGIGSNWAVTGEQDAVERVADDLGARLLGAD